MTAEVTNSRDSHFFLEQTTLYQEFLAQREEIMRHKWIESEKEGRDIGFDVALVDWVTKYRTAWLRERSARRTGLIEYFLEA